MIETGLILKTTREKMGVSLEEVSRDLEIPVLLLEQIEAGAVGAFEDIYVLKDMMLEYSKYLGVETEEVLKKFNEYMFDYTSKIPIQDIEKAIVEQQKEEFDEDVIHSPYTVVYKKGRILPYILIGSIIIILILLIVIWCITGISNQGVI